MGVEITKSDIRWNYAGTVTSLGINFLMLPFMMVFMDPDYLGLWYVFASVGGIVSLFDFGFNPVLSRNVAYCWSGVGRLEREGSRPATGKEPNYALLKQLLQTCRVLYLVIAAAAAAVLLCAGLPYMLHIGSGLETPVVASSWLIYLAAVFMNLFFGYYSVFLWGTGNVAGLNKANVLARVAQLAVSVAALALGFGIVGVSAAYFLFGLLSRVLYRRFFYGYNDVGRQLDLVEEPVSREQVGELFSIVWHNAWKEGVVGTSNYLTNQASTVVMSLFFSLSETGTYSMMLQIATAIVTIASSRFAAVVPAVQSAYAERRPDRTVRLVSYGLVVYALAWAICTMGSIVFVLPLLEWVNPAYQFDVPLMAVICLYLFVFKRYSNYATVIACTNRVPYLWAFSASSLGAVALACAVLALFETGPWGLVLSQLCVQLLYNAWKWPREVRKMLGTSEAHLIACGMRQIPVLSRLVGGRG